MSTERTVRLAEPTADCPGGGISLERDEPHDCPEIEPVASVRVVAMGRPPTARGFGAYVPAPATYTCGPMPTNKGPAEPYFSNRERDNLGLPPA